MKQRKYLYTLYLIIATIVISIATQVYFNYKNYQKNKRQFINEVQISLDNAVENYFANLAKEKFSFTRTKGIQEKISLKVHNKIDSLELDSLTKSVTSVVFTDDDNFNFIKMIKQGNNKPVIHQKKGGFPSLLSNKNKSLSIFADSLNAIKGITSVFISITENNLRLKELEKIFDKELLRKDIQLPYKLNHYSGKELIATNDSISKFINSIKTTSKSTYLKKSESLELEFPNQTKTYLKRGLLGILLSLMLTLAIIASLFYLLNIIKKQKAIAEIKNDFISNITHEFKTPITTIGLALDSIHTFSEQNKKEKTKEYVVMGKNQLNKLTKMVEKVLETATLDSKELFLRKKPTDVVLLIETVVTKFKQVYTEKEFHFTSNQSAFIVNLDKFHFENAFNNLLDNACKYGGDSIEVSVNSDKENTEILISDSGSIPKNQQNKIFDKFYRIPQGDRHDVKGFGIGLYYTKKIIEKHQGSISLLDTKNTIFKIEIPNV